MFGKIVYHTKSTNKYYTYKTDSKYKFEKMKKGLRKNKYIKIDDIIEMWYWQF